MKPAKESILAVGSGADMVELAMVDHVYCTLNSPKREVEEPTRVHAQ